MKKAFIAGLENSAKVLKQFVETMTDDVIKRRIKDYWTIYDHIDHLVVCQKMLLERIEAFIKEESPVIEPYNPEEKPSEEASKRTARQLVNEFRKLRAKQIKLIKGAKKAVWLRKGSHEEYADYGFEILVRHILLHDSYHMYRMEELWIMKEHYIKELK